MAADPSTNPFIRRALEDQAAGVPSGLVQENARIEGAQSRGGLNPWQRAAAASPLQAAQNWYGGQNTEGVANGWDTQFYGNMFAQRDEWLQKAADAGSPSMFYDWLDPNKNKQATGVLTWDSGVQFGGRTLRRGDVLNNGAWVGNVYEDYDEPTADVLMGELLLPGHEKARLNEAPDRAAAYRQAVSARMDEESRAAAGAISAEEYQNRVAATAEGLRDFQSMAGTVAAAAGGGAVTGAGIGATIGSIVPVIGTALGAGAGAILGTVAGGLGAWLNQDQITELEARATVQVDMANQRNGKMAALTTGLGAYSEVGMSFLAPTQNLFQGAYDWGSGGGVGDGVSAYYAVDEEGNRLRSGWLTAVDVLALGIDSVGQFGKLALPGKWKAFTDANRKLYLGGMGGGILGGGGQMLTMQAGFNERIGDFDKYENGKEWAAAGAVLMIDVAQLGMAGAVARVTNRAREFGGKPLMAAAGTTDDVSLNGIRFTLDDVGVAQAAKTSRMELFAPSEFLKWSHTKWRARTLARETGVVEPDDLYRAALEMTRSGSKFKDIYMVAYPEAVEEFVQTALEPYSFGERMELREAALAGLYGFAAGAGMGIGAMAGYAPMNQKVLEARAQTLFMLRNGLTEPPKDWDARWERMSPLERDRAAIASQAETEELGRILEVMAEMSRLDTSEESMIGLAVERDERMDRWAQTLKSANVNIGGALTAMGRTSNQQVGPNGEVELVDDANAASLSAWELVHSLEKIHRSHLVQAKDLDRRFTAAREALAAATEAGDQAGVDEANRLLGEYKAEAVDTQGQAAISERIADEFRAAYNELLDEPDLGERVRKIGLLNKRLKEAFTGNWTWVDGTAATADEVEWVRRAVELKLGRHPFIDTGSFGVFLPQISVEMTKANTHGVVQVHQATLKAMQADHDGDKEVRLNEVYYPPAKLEQLRRGFQYFGPVLDEVLEADSLKVQMDAPDGEAAWFQNMRRVFSDPSSTAAQSAIKRLKQLEDHWVLEYDSRFGGPIETSVLRDLMNEFFSGVLTGDAGSRIRFIEGMYNANPIGMLGTADRNHIPANLAISADITTVLDGISRERAKEAEKNRPAKPTWGPAPNPKPRKFQKQKALKDSGDAGAQLGIMGTAEALRNAQSVYYSPFYRAATLMGQRLEESGFIESDRIKLVEMYVDLKSGAYQSEMDTVTGKYDIEDRVMGWLRAILKENGIVDNLPHHLVLMANVRVPDLKYNDKLKDWELTGGKVTLLQLLLQRSLEIESAKAATAAADSDIKRRISKLQAYTREQGPHSYTWALALGEVMGSETMYDLLGDQAEFLGSQYTMGQMVQRLQGMDVLSMNQEIHKLRSTAPYKSHHSMGDPPYTLDKISGASPEMTSYTLVVDAVAAIARARVRDLKRQSDDTGADFRAGLSQIHALMDAWATEHGARLRQQTGSRTLDDRAVLRDMLRTRPDYADLIASLIPKAARPAAFRLVDGRLYAARWVEGMLLERNTERAEVLRYVHTKLAEFNALGGNVKHGGEEFEEQQGDVTGEVKYRQIKSRFLQTLYVLATDADGIELNLFIKAAQEAESVDKLFERINSEPMWLGQRAELIPYADDVADFDVTPKDVWQADRPGALEREALRMWSQRMAVISPNFVADSVNRKAERELLRDMLHFLRTGEDPDGRASEAVAQLKALIEQRKTFIDTNGQAAREQMMEAVQHGLLSLADKGTPDERFERFGSSTVTALAYGLSQAWQQELSQMSMHAIEDVLSNPTKLMDGSTRIMFDDGSWAELDMRDPETVVQMLLEPRLNGLAKSVLFPMTRDVNNNNVLGFYLDTNGYGNFAAMLAESDLGHLFAERSSWSGKVKQAHQLIGMVEAGLMKRSQTRGLDEQERAFFPLANLMNDLIVAYKHSARADTMSDEAIRDRIAVDVADALKAVSSLDDGLHPQLMKAIKARLKARYSGDRRGLQQMMQSEEDKAIFDLSFMGAIQDGILTRMTALQDKIDYSEDQLTNPNVSLSPAERQDLLDQIEAMSEERDLLSASATSMTDADAFLLNPPEFLSVEETVDQFSTKGLTGAALFERRRKIYDFLKHKERMERFRSKDTRMLIAKVRMAADSNPAVFSDPKALEDSEWETLALWAATADLSERATRSSSELGLVPLTDDPSSMVNKYYDRSWSYLLDPLFDDQVLEIMRELSAWAQFAHVDWSSDRAEDVLMRGMFDPRLLGPWTDRVPVESLKARMALRGSSVAMGIPTAGNSPKENADTVGASWQTFKKPRDEHLTLHEATFDGTIPLTEFIKRLPGLKLDHHFVKSIEVIAPQAKSGANFQTSLMMNSTYAPRGVHESVERSGYRVLTLSRLEATLGQLIVDEELTDFELKITYVDVDKKPHELDYVNSVYFDGLGRDLLTGGGMPGPISAMVFGAGTGTSKLSQQMLLDFLSKKGSPYRPTPLSDLNAVKNIEGTGGRTVTEVLHEKTEAMWRKEYYDIPAPVKGAKQPGRLTTGDRVALYKLMKMRHLVVGTNASGQQEVRWAEDIIQLETTGSNPLTNWTLVPISDSVLQTLLGKSGQMGTRNFFTRPTLNVQDMGQLPKLDVATLQKLGLANLGHKRSLSELGDTILGQVSVPPKAVVTSERGGEMNDRLTRRRATWRQQSHEAQAPRLHGAEWGKERLRDIQVRNLPRLAALMQVDAMSWVLARMGVPFPEMRQNAGNLISSALATQLADSMSDINVAWEYDAAGSTDLTNGVLSPEVLADGFPPDRPETLIHGDLVTLNIDRFLTKHNNDREAAFEDAKNVITTLSTRGVTVALGSEFGEETVRSKLADWMDEGELDYRRLGYSPNIYVPIMDNETQSRLQRAVESTSVHSPVFTADDIALQILNDEYFGMAAGGSEGTFFVDFAKDKTFGRLAHVILPTNLTYSSGPGSDRAFAFNIPTPGRDLDDQVTRAYVKLERMLADPRTVAHLKKMHGGDPENVPLFKKHKDSGMIEPGILSFDDAIAELLQRVRDRKPIPDAGMTLMTGSFIPTVDKDNNILLTRVGFKPPPPRGEYSDKKTPGILDQLATARDQTAPQEGERGLGVAIFSNQLNEAQTVPPPFKLTEVRRTRQGLAVLGRVELDKYGKWVQETIGVKQGVVELTAYSFPDRPMGMFNDVRPTQAGSELAVEGKAGFRGMVRNFRWAFALSGIDFREDIIDVFFGEAAQPRSEKEVDALWDQALMILQRWKSTMRGFSIEDVELMMDSDALADLAAREINTIGQQIDSNWTNIELAAHDDTALSAKKVIVSNLMGTLLAPGVDITHLVATPGLLTVKPNSGTQIRLLPPMFTQSLNNPAHPEVKQYLIDRINAAFPRDADGKPDYELTSDFRLNHRMYDSQGEALWMENSILQMVLPSIAEENPVAGTNADVTRTKQSAGHHIVNVINAATGGRVFTDKDVYEDFDRMFGQNEIMWFETADDPNFWDMLNRIAPNDSSYSPWERRLPLEHQHIVEADAKVRHYTMPIDKTGWAEATQARAKAGELLSALGFEKGRIADELIEVDYLVRQFWGKPGAAKADEVAVEDIDSSAYIEAVTLMLENVRTRKMQPLHGGMVPMPHSVFWRKVYEANRAKANGWAPVTTDGSISPVAREWDSWVQTLFGQVRNSNKDFESMFRTDLDGFFHTYQGETNSTLSLPVSMNPEVALGLRDPRTNELFISFDPGQNALYHDPVILDTMQKTYSAITGHQTVVFGELANEVPVSEFSEQREHIRKWLRKNTGAKQTKVPVKNYLQDGVRYIESERTSNAFFRGLVNMSITTRLLNPPLYASAFIEVPVRNALEHATNLLTGSNIGAGGAAIARGAERINAATERAGFENVRMTPRYTAEEVAQLNNLSRTLGQSNRWMALLYDEMTFSGYVERGQGRIGSGLEWAARQAARATSDPRFGQKMSSAAKRYIEGAMEYLMYTDSAISVEQLVQHLEQDPLWLEKQAPRTGFSAHRAGMNRVAQVRSAKASTVSHMIMGGIDSLAASPSLALNTAGLLAKIPFMFTRFNANAFITMTGLGGFDQLMAMAMDGRQRPGLFARMGAAVRGEEYIPGTRDTYDMSDVLEGVDLVRPFIRGGVTQTALVALALMGANLGLDGEDEEERRRRRMAEYLNLPVIFDPRRAENDFLNADAIYLDSIPGLNNFFQDESGRSAVVPHWIVRQFTSPIIGVHRFLKNGNLAEIGWGFQDAISVMPITVMNLWKEADLTAQMLAEAAADDNMVDVPEMQGRKLALITQIAGVYEKALIENAFVNSLRNGGDPYNRNPWLVPKTDDTSGNIVHFQGRNNMPERTEALEQYVDENGQPQKAYLTRTDGGLTGAYSHQYAENNATYAFLASLISGQVFDPNNSFRRGNMVVSQKTIPLPETTKAEAEAFIYQMYENLGPQVELTYDETLRVLKQQAQDSGQWWDQSDLEEQASAIFAASSGRHGGLSILDDEGRELLTKDGGAAIFRGLHKGSITMKEAAALGIHISKEMRDEIAEEWTTELVQEGVDLGLSQEAAMYRMRRIWFGDNTDPSAPALRQLLYSNDIPRSDTLKYNQLNMTYAIGPDGRPWATPYPRQSVLQALGLPFPTAAATAGKGMSKDARGKLIDDVYGINLGLHGLERVQEDPIEPDDAPMEKAMSKTYTPSTGSYKKWPSRRYGGGDGSSYGPPFQRMQPLPRGGAPRPDETPFINVSNPYIRRANTNRQRIYSERGRLKQWQ